MASVAYATAMTTSSTTFQGHIPRDRTVCGTLELWRNVPKMPDVNVVAAEITEDLHAWEAGGAASAEALSAWVGARLAAHEAALAALLAVEGPRTTENTLRFYDAAIEQLSLAGAQAGILNSVAADKIVRDQAQVEAQRVSMAGSALSLNRGVYEALAAIDLDAENPPVSPATRHFV